VKMLSFMKGTVLSLVLAACVAVTGCASLVQNVDQAKIVVQLSTMKVVEAGKDRHARAEQIQKIAAEAAVLLDASSVSVDVVADAVRVRVASLHLEPSDAILANMLIDAVASDLKQKVGDGVIEPDKKVRVNAVLTWVSDAARFY
jgi:hypothetical protein